MEVPKSFTTLIAWKFLRRFRRWIMTVGIFAVVCIAVFQLLSEQRTSTGTETDLAGSWEMCFPASGDASRCDWINVHVPSDLSSSLPNHFQGWVFYRTSFLTPNHCVSEPCSIFIKEIGDSAEAYINGRSLGRHGDFPPNAQYAKHYPVLFDLSRHALRPSQNSNELLIKTYSMKKVQAGIRGGPVGIFSARDAFKLAQWTIGMNVVVPLLGFLGLFLFAVLAMVMAGIYQESDQRIHTYIRYCLAASAFLLSFSEVPREYLPIGISGPLHFLFRILSDWAFFELVTAYYVFGVKLKRFGRWCYGGFTFALFLQIWIHLIAGTTEGQAFDVAYATLRTAPPLLLLPHILGIIGSFYRSQTKEGKAGLLAFTVLFAMQSYDILIFHHVISGTYFVKWYPLMIGLMFGAFLLERFRVKQTRILVEHEEAKHEAVLAEWARDVSHNIRSPLVSLENLHPRLIDITDQQRSVLRNAIIEIKDLANGLKQRANRKSRNQPMINPSIGTNNEEQKSVQLISSLVEQVIYQKRVEKNAAPGIKIVAPLRAASYGLFSEVQPIKFRCALSNLINNAVESIESDSGEVTVTSVLNSNTVVIAVHDTGKGIPKELLPYLGKRGHTFGKLGGTGLGLSHAKDAIESWGGRLSIQSGEGKGTTVSIELPLAVAPDWFLSELRIAEGSDICVVDDDSSIRSMWEMRFDEAGLLKNEIKVDYFSKGGEMPGLTTGSRKKLYLVDYKLGDQEKTGLDWIEELKISESSVLVTGHAEESAVTARARFLGVKVIPKTLAGIVPIAVESIS